MKILRRIRAALGGHFWIHCPICDEEFGGFEIGKGSVDLGDGRKRICCKNCDYIAGQIDGVNNPYPMIESEEARKFFKTALGQADCDRPLFEYNETLENLGGITPPLKEKE